MLGYKKWRTGIYFDELKRYGFRGKIKLIDKKM